jgi:hypothetical protein
VDGGKTRRDPFSLSSGIRSHRDTNLLFRAAELNRAEQLGRQREQGTRDCAAHAPPDGVG